MIFATLLVGFVAASTAFALPPAQGQDLRRREKARTSRSQQTRNGPVSDITYSSTLAGVVLEAPTGTTWKSITGTIAIPAEKGTGTGTYYFDAFIGIDGYTCGTASLQLGIGFTVKGTTSANDPWYEYYPDYAYDFSGITVPAGSTVKLTITANSKTSGTVTVQNLTTGISVTKTLTETYPLCLEDAEWFIEEEPATGATYYDFGSVEFTNAYATLNTGTIVYPPSGTVVNLGTGLLGSSYTTVTTGASSVTITYV